MSELNASKTGCATCNRRSPLFELLSKDELLFVDQNRYEIRFKAGEIIRKQGAFLSHVISINSGLAKMYLEGENDTDIILKIIKPTNFIGGPGMYIDHRHHYTVAALTETSACFIEVNAFKKLIHDNSDFAEGFFKDFSKNTLRTYDHLINLTHKQAAGRMAEGLIYLSKYIFHSKKFDLLISKRDLGYLTGMSKDSVIRILRKFKEKGFINNERNDIEILDFDTLETISKTGWMPE